MLHLGCQVSVHRERAIMASNYCQLALIVISLVHMTWGQISGDESCETLPSEIHLIKGKLKKKNDIHYSKIYVIPSVLLFSKFIWNLFLIFTEEYDEIGRLQRTCNGEVAVNKCEGACNSQVQPSVITPTGFLKECYCCRESFLRERVVTLTHCYDPDGMRLTSDEMSTMNIKLREPSDCKCFKCGDFSR